MMKEGGFGVNRDAEGEENPTPERIEEEKKSEVGGREIRGLEPKEEHFSTLVEGVDFSFSTVNPEVITDANPRDYILFVNPTNGDRKLVVTPPHWRTISCPISASIIKNDGTTDYFFEANTKGVGYLKPTVKGYSIDDLESWTSHDFIEGERILGIKNDHLGKRSSVKKMEISQELSKSGLRTEVHWAIALLKRIPFNGEMTPIRELQEAGVFPRKLEDKNMVVRPIEMVRLLKTNTRVEEALLADERRGEIFSQAFDVFNKEARLEGSKEAEIGNRAKEQLFFKTFSYRIGKNLATLLNAGYAHCALHSSNVSMAAEFVDIDPIIFWNDETKASGWREEYEGLRLHHIKDIRDAIYSLRRLYKAGRKAGLSTGSRESLVENIINGFNDGYDANLAENNGIDEISVKNWLKKIAAHVLVEKKNLNSLIHYSIDTWEI